MWYPYYVSSSCRNLLYRNWAIFNNRGVNISHLSDNFIRQKFNNNESIFNNNENNVKSAPGNYALSPVNFFLSIIFKNESVMSDSETKSHLIIMFFLSFII